MLTSRYRNCHRVEQHFVPLSLFPVSRCPVCAGRRYCFAFCAIALALLLSSVALAQEESQEEVQEEKIIQKKSSFRLAFDFPLIPERIIANMDNIKEQPFGRSVQPVVGSFERRYSLIPRLNAFSKNFNFHLGVDRFVIRDDGMVRENMQADAHLEGSLWLVLIGVGGRYFQENIPNVLSGEEYHVDFDRQSYGGRVWAGLKMGGFHTTFIAVRAGKGRLWTEGNETYSSMLDEDFKILLFSDQFDVSFQSLEGRVALPYLAPFFLAEKNVFKKLEESGLFGLEDDSFENVKMVWGAELMPAGKGGVFRIVVRKTNYFGSDNDLYFGNRQPEWQGYVRFVF